VTYAINASVFDFLTVLDGVCAIENGPQKGDLELYYVKGSIKNQLNEQKGDLLHDLFQS
jgi:hypothetical protein